MIKIRLRRVGSKKKPQYRLVVADVRSPRDGRFIDIIGHYNPLADPETVVIDEEKARHWLERGAQPTDTAARLLAKIGIIEEPKARKEKIEASITAKPAVSKKKANASPEEESGTKGKKAKASAEGEPETNKGEAKASVEEGPETKGEEAKASVKEEPETNKDESEADTVEKPEK